MLRVPADSLHIIFVTKFVPLTSYQNHKHRQSQRKYARKNSLTKLQQLPGVCIRFAKGNQSRKLNLTGETSRRRWERWEDRWTSKRRWDHWACARCHSSRSIYGVTGGLWDHRATASFRLSSLPRFALLCNRSKKALLLWLDGISEFRSHGSMECCRNSPARSPCTLLLRLRQTLP